MDPDVTNRPYPNQAEPYSGQPQPNPAPQTAANSGYAVPPSPAHLTQPEPQQFRPQQLPEPQPAAAMPPAPQTIQDFIPPAAAAPAPSFQPSQAVTPQPFSGSVPAPSSSGLPLQTDYAVPPAVPANNTAAAASSEYISNPFLNSLRGLVLQLQVNPIATLLTGLIGGVAPIALYAIMVLSIFATHSVAVFFILFLVGMVAYIGLAAAFLIVAGSSSRGHAVTAKQALSSGFGKLLPMLGLAILSGLAIGIGLILLIVPGVYLMARLSLSGLVLVEENLGPIAAMKRSFSLTKGHVNEMLGAYVASLLMGGGGSLLVGATSMAPLVGRYHDLRQLKESGGRAPKVHFLNYLYIPFIILEAILLAVMIAVGNNAKDHRNTNQAYPGYYNSSANSTSTDADLQYYNQE